MLRPPLKNFHLFGDDKNRNTYSNVNHVIQTASTTASLWLSSVCPSCFSWRAGKVLKVSPIVDSTMNRMERTATTCNR